MSDKAGGATCCFKQQPLLYDVSSNESLVRPFNHNKFRFNYMKKLLDGICGAT